MPRQTYCLPDAETEHAFHERLARFNERRLAPGQTGEHWIDDVYADLECRVSEGRFIESERIGIRHQAAQAPGDADGMVRWFEGLRDSGPGQSDVLFPWLAKFATFAQMRWFLSQEAAGEAGFEDLVALTLVKFPVRAKLEMARNFWDEMGRGHARGMHGPMLAAVVSELQLTPSAADTCWESLALANLMVGLAANRRYAYQSVGARGAIEMTAPGRVTLVNEGLLRLDVPVTARKYFQLHAGLDIQHSRAWNLEVIHTLVAEYPESAHPIAEGALLRLTSGARCFARYRGQFALEAEARPTHSIRQESASMRAPTISIKGAVNIHRPSM
jgi:hypothetical protein